ncbi:HNH endonuclease [Kitasatospora sp. NPDC088160]|uniref:HNH endonuclease n=1 Tax=Kitasatospora sp. NPDC088160 TaxID=3364072 RepID=UPI0037F9619C
MLEAIRQQIPGASMSSGHIIVDRCTDGSLRLSYDRDRLVLECFLRSTTPTAVALYEKMAADTDALTELIEANVNTGSSGRFFRIEDPEPFDLPGTDNFEECAQWMVQTAQAVRQHIYRPLMASAQAKKQALGSPRRDPATRQERTAYVTPIIPRYREATGPAQAVQVNSSIIDQREYRLDPDPASEKISQGALDSRVAPGRSTYRTKVEALEQLLTAAESSKAREVTHTEPMRRRNVRDMVIDRAGQRCESPECGNPDFYAERRKGGPVLEVDHVQDFRFNGPDHPANMIALCPNCHAVKTHGVDGERLRELFVAAVRERHERAMLGG